VIFHYAISVILFFQFYFGLQHNLNTGISRITSKEGAAYDKLQYCQEKQDFGPGSGTRRGKGT
jgi:hypothetical protein